MGQACILTLFAQSKQISPRWSDPAAFARASGLQAGDSQNPDGGISVPITVKQCRKHGLLTRSGVPAPNPTGPLPDERDSIAGSKARPARLDIALPPQWALNVI